VASKNAFRSGELTAIDLNILPLPAAASGSSPTGRIYDKYLHGGAGLQIEQADRPDHCAEEAVGLAALIDPRTCLRLARTGPTGMMMSDDRAKPEVASGGSKRLFFPDRKWNSCYPCALGFVTDPPRISKSRIRKPSPKPRLNRLFTMFAVLLY
jgi:hypothetical protein